MFAFFSIIIFPCFAQLAFSEPTRYLERFNKSIVMDWKASLEYFECVFIAVPGITEGYNIGRQGENKGFHYFTDYTNTMNINSNEGTNKSNANGNKNTSILYEYVFDHGFIGFIAWFILFPFLFPSLFRKHIRGRQGWQYENKKRRISIMTMDGEKLRYVYQGRGIPPLGK